DGVPSGSKGACVDNQGTVEVTGDSARAWYLRVGRDDRGAVIQSGGSMYIYERVVLGFAADAYGSYQLDGGDFWAAKDMVLGMYGEGLFEQSAGTVSVQGLHISAYDNYNGGLGVYRQTGGTHNATRITLYSGGSYELADEAVLNSVLVDGDGTFSQTGGTHQTRDIDTVSYTITGGELEADELLVTQILSHGIATFDQADSDAQVTVNDFLVVGRGGSQYGEYMLRAGNLTVNGYEVIGSTGGQGLFQQTGGVHRAARISVRSSYGNTSRFELLGGTLTVVTAMDLRGGGELSFPSPGGELIFEDQASADFSRGSLIGAGNAIINGGAESLIIFPAGFDPYSQLGSYTNPGITHISGSTLLVPDGKTVRFVGILDDHVICEGRLAGSMDLADGVEVGSNGLLEVGQGTITVRDHVSGIDGGAIFAKELAVGAGTAATFRHVSGTVDLSSGQLSLRADLGIATYEMGPGAILKTGITKIGWHGGNASFLQTGGVHDTDSLYITWSTYYPPDAKYELTGGQLRVAGPLLLGGYGSARASFAISGGELTVGARLYVGVNGSIARFDQEGGDVKANTLTVATSTYAPIDGMYTIGGGSLTTGGTEIGGLGLGRFVHTGGDHVVNGTLSIASSGAQPGSYT
ncbi:hypothetical protein LCGC14_2179600, partial [marine sediment metagenome]